MPNEYNFLLKNFGLENVKVYRFEDAPEGKQTEYPKQNAQESHYMTTGRKTDKLTTWLGTTVFADIILSNGKSGAEERSVQLISALVSVDQAKIIERTPVRGRRGQVKEYWSMDDYSVKIQGAILDQRPDYYPQIEIEKLIELLELNQSLHVVSRYLQMFGIYEIAVNNFTFAPIEQSPNVQLFDIMAYSDEPEELMVKYEK
jgi:Domain of unknown function (DUF6046)